MRVDGDELKAYRDLVGAIRSRYEIEGPFYIDGETGEIGSLPACESRKAATSGGGREIGCPTSRRVRSDSELELPATTESTDDFPQMPAMPDMSQVGAEARRRGDEARADGDQRRKASDELRASLDLKSKAMRSRMDMLKKDTAEQTEKTIRDRAKTATVPVSGDDDVTEMIANAGRNTLGTPGPGAMLPLTSPGARPGRPEIPGVVMTERGDHDYVTSAGGRGDRRGRRRHQREDAGTLPEEDDEDEGPSVRGQDL